MEALVAMQTRNALNLYEILNKYVTDNCIVHWDVLEIEYVIYEIQELTYNSLCNAIFTKYEIQSIFPIQMQTKLYLIFQIKSKDN